MTLSIWWFVGLSQLTLIAILGCIFSISALKNTKKQRDSLKDSVAQTTKDYYEFIESIESKFATQQKSLIQNLPNADHHSSKIIINMLESIPTELKKLYPHATPEQLESSQLALYLELQLLHILDVQDSDHSSKREHWENFIQQLSSNIEENRNKYSELHQIFESIRLDWQEKKSSLQNTFETIVKTTQKAEHSNEIHNNLNILYNDFINILNRIPGVTEENQDALLQMESVDTSPEILDYIDSSSTSADAISESPDESKLEHQTQASPINHDLSDPSVNTDVRQPEIIENPAENFSSSLEQVMPISELNLDDDEDLLQTNQAIEDFDEEQLTSPDTQIKPETLNPEKMIEESLGMEDDDIFGDLMSAMDEAIASRQEQDSTTKKDQKQS